MNYSSEERLDALASAYVLGTLEGRARRRFIRLMQQKTRIRERVWFWEQMLDPLNDRLEPQPPPAHVWPQIRARLGMAVAANDEPAPSRRWVSWAGGFATAAMVLAGLYLTVPGPAPVMVEQVAVFTDADGQTLWLLDVSDQQIAVRATGLVSVSAEYDYELWMVPADGGAPRSLGLMPEDGSLVLPLTEDLSADMVKAIAVSREAPGGSMTGAPAEVLYVTPLLST